ncbi:MAG: AraC family transcriptional regulator [Clostridia bacterium]|nr:AraC family transcriptional regulator [Clostridia bacterium]
MLQRRGIQMVRQLKTYLNCSAGILVSQPFSSMEGLLEQLRICRQDAQDFFYQSAQSAQCCTVADGSPFSQEVPSPPPETAAVQLADAFAKNPESADIWVQSLIQRCRESRTAPQSLKHYIFLLLQRLIINQPNVSESITFASHVQVFACTSSQQLCSLLHSLLPSLLQLPDTADDGKNADVRTVILYLQQHYADRITLEMLAGMINLDKSYLCRLFKRETGESILQFLTRIRLEKAASLLRKGSASAKDISSLVEFDDPFYFNRLFKKQYGMTPGEYRERKSD